MSIISTIKVKFAAKTYSRREATLSYDGCLVLDEEQFNLAADVSRVKFRRHGSSVDVKVLFSRGEKLTVRFYDKCASLVTNKGKMAEEEEEDGEEEEEQRDIAFARLFGRLLANENQNVIGTYEDPFSTTSDLLSFGDTLDEMTLLESTPLRPSRDSFYLLPPIEEISRDDSPSPKTADVIQKGSRDIETMKKYVLGELSFPDDVVLSWLPGVRPK